jgi:hypothetical protein
LSGGAPRYDHRPVAIAARGSGHTSLMPIFAPTTITTYDVDAQAVADAIVRRLLAGRAFLPARELEPA